MSWVDLAAVSFFLWGAVAGYLQGSRKMLFKVAALILAIFLAHIFQEHLVLFLGQQYFLTDMIAEGFFNQMTLPVDTVLDQSILPVGRFSLLLRGLALPEGMSQLLMELLSRQDVSLAAAELVGEGKFLAAMLTQITVNVFSFIACVFAIRGVFSLYEIIFVYRSKGKTGHLLDHACGLIIGAANSMLLLVMISGFFYPLGLFRQTHFLSRELYNGVILEWGFRAFLYIANIWI